jgi:predicted RNase H-like HicB family nuclease
MDLKRRIARLSRRHPEEGGLLMKEKELRNDSYIGLFRAFPKREWRVKFPDLPGCEATGANLQDTLESARAALAEHLRDAREQPRPRTRAELLSDAQGNWLFCREFVDAVMLPVEPVRRDDPRV